jgi:transcriptional regulator with XRE-family HTH domain
MTTGQKMMQARLDLKMTRKALSQITGIHPMTLARYEYDTAEPCLSYAVRIADALGITLDYLGR